MIKTRSFFKFYIAMLFFAFSMQNQAYSEMNIISQSTTGLSLSYLSGTALQDTIVSANHIYTALYFDGHIFSGASGSPALPIQTIRFATPPNSNPSLSISDIKTNDVTDIDISPIPTIIRDNQNFTVETYREDPTEYAMSGFRPEAFVHLDHLEEYGGVSLWELTVSPIKYDTYNNNAIIASSINISISFNSDDIITPTKPLPPGIVNREIFHFNAPMKTATSISPFSDGNWFKITFNTSGMYRITGNQLLSAGFPVGAISSDEIHAFYGGGRTIDTVPRELTTDNFREIAILIEDGDDGIFDLNDRIIFYGQSLSRFIVEDGGSRLVYQNHPYSETNAIWITASINGPPKRMEYFGESPSSSVPLHDTYRCFRHIEQENEPELGNGSIEWYWLEVKNQIKSVSVSAPEFEPGETTNIRIAFLNIDNICDVERKKSKNHDIDVIINGQSYETLEIKGVPKAEFDLEYDDNFNTDSNIINIRRDSDNNTDAIHLDWIELEYSRTLRIENNSASFFMTGNDAPYRLSIADVQSNSMRVFDTTDPYNVRIHASPQYNITEKTLVFQDDVPDGKTVEYTIWNENLYRNVISASAKTSDVLRETSIDINYVVISHPLFLDAAHDLAAWRGHDSQNEPLTPLVVDVNDIFDAFNWGVYDPSAIRDFLKYTWEHGDPSKNYYCLLLGDTIQKFKNLTPEQAEQNFIPSFTTYDTLGKLISDDYFTWITKNQDSAFSIGRFCVSDKESAQSLVEKTIDYEASPEPGRWHNTVFIAADDEFAEKNDEVYHSQQAELLDVGLSNKEFIPYTFERNKLMMIEYPMKNNSKPEATEAFIKAFNDGFVAGTYIGHGNKGLIAHEHLFVGDRDIDRLQNDNRLPLFGMFSCATADFIQQDNNSLAEMFHTKKTGGCIGVVAASSETYADFNKVLGQEFFYNIFNNEVNPEHRLGKSLLIAKSALTFTYNSYRYMLLGDPATRLMIPQYSFQTAPVDSLFRLHEENISGSIIDGNSPASYGNATLYFKAHGPRIHKTYTTAHNTIVNYTMPGKVFFNAEKQISGGDFDISFVVPKDMDTSGDDTIIHLFATTNDPDIPEAAAKISGFSIAGLHPDAADDRSGPEISFMFDGKAFNDGDSVSRQPTLVANIFDESGINIIGQRGHNISLTIDDTETTILTDKYHSINSYQSGALEFTLPLLSPGEHTLELSVYDSYNNGSRKRADFTVVGSQTGDIVIRDLLNWPNPMANDGTTFTFNLTDETRRAELKVYSQAGRLVDSVTFSAAYGFNTFYWKPPFTLANGVYFYKLSVLSFTGRSSSKIEKLVVMK